MTVAQLHVITGGNIPEVFEESAFELDVEVELGTGTQTDGDALLYAGVVTVLWQRSIAFAEKVNTRR